MSLEKLTIFSKDTDATEALRGYEYQKLRAAENWLENYLAQNNEVIYCDYEEDVFQRNLDSWVSKFTQLKLYSSKNFSFTSIEVTKAISHFFMLFVKGEYKFDTVQFNFETNAAVARNYGDNDADLLQKWKDNQDNMDAALVKQCAEKVKSIIIDYATKAANGTNDQQLIEKIKEAQLQLYTLPDEVWDNFVKTIRWSFSDIPAEQAIENVIEKINDQITQTGFPSANAQKESVFARLYYSVSEKSIQENPDHRKLDSGLLDSLLLDSGSEQDKGYNEDYKAWSEVTEIKHFRASEFYQVVNLANFCRHSDYLKRHSAMWVELLKKYIALGETPLRNKQKAIYELLWVSLRVKMLEEPQGTLIGQEAYIKQYFSVVKEFDDHESLEDAVALIGIVQGSAAFGKADINLDEIADWRKELLDIGAKALANARDQNEACYFHEIIADLLLHNTVNPDYPTHMDDVFVHFDAILTALDRADLYNVGQLSDRINAFIKILIVLKHDISEIERLEDFSDKLMPYAAKKSSDHVMAKKYVDRGIKYLESTEPLSILRALDYFHKAKTLWRHDQTKEGYILALINIAQLYATAGSNLAAKYYALCAVRHATENEDQHRRIPDAFAFVLLADFQEGAWISCLEDFRMYFTSRGEYKTTDLDNDEMVKKSFTLIGTIISLAPRISPQLNGLIAYEKIKLNGLYNELIADYVNYIDDHFSDAQIPGLIQNKLDDTPLNDLGNERSITWNALGTEWKIKFSNSWLMNSLGEEFAALLQILITELGLCKIDLHLLKSKVEISIEEGAEWAPPVRKASNDIHRWIVKMPSVIEEDYDKIKMQPAFVLTSLKIILDDISLLPHEELYTEIQEMFEKRDLAGKTMPDYLYQRLYRYLFSENHFNESQRGNFENLTDVFDIPGFSALKWNDSISGKYSPESSLELINGRYDNGLKAIYLTLAELKKDIRYLGFLELLRNEGWLDWQITLAMLNHIVSYKVNEEVAGMQFQSPHEQRTVLQKMMSRIARTDEKDNYAPLPLDYFLGDAFKFQLKQVALIVLHNWKLESKSEYPDLVAIQEFLTVRFNFNIDDDPSKSPL